jgi:hypothetical protein
MTGEITAQLIAIVQGYTYSEYMGMWVANGAANDPENCTNYGEFRILKERLIAAILCNDTRDRDRLERQLILV